MPGKTKPAAPSKSQLQERLGTRSYNALETFLEQNAELRPEWKYYGEKYGWSLKLFDGKRNICFITAHDGYFALAFMLGTRTTDAALAARLPAALKTQIKEARVYAEGRGVHFEIRSKAELETVQRLLEIKRSN